MAVKQYIGARYVPEFADPLDWDSSKTYEPLTIVYYEGNSYTSRQSVPTSIDINNTDYWALTGNYNAQIEQYRTEVQQYQQQVSSFDGRITDNANSITENENEINALTTGLAKTGKQLKKYIDVTGYVDDFENVDANTVINQALEENPEANSIYFPPGVYVFSEPYDFTATSIYNISGNGAYFLGDNLDYIIKPNPNNEKGCNLSGITFHGNDSCKTAISTTQQNRIIGCQFTGFTDVVIGSGSQGVQVIDCWIEVRNPSELPNVVGINGTSDWQIIGCHIWGCQKSIQLTGGNNFISDCYFWNFKHPDSVTALDAPNSATTVSNCMFDTINIPINGTVTASNCSVYFNEADRNDEDYFYFQYQDSESAGIVSTYNGLKVAESAGWTGTINHSSVRQRNVTKNVQAVKNENNYTDGIFNLLQFTPMNYTSLPNNTNWSKVATITSDISTFSVQAIIGIASAAAVYADISETEMRIPNQLGPINYNASNFGVNFYQQDGQYMADIYMKSQSGNNTRVGWTLTTCFAATGFFVLSNAIDMGTEFTPDHIATQS